MAGILSKGITLSYKKNEVYTIVGEKKGAGAKKWLKLKSGAPFEKIQEQYDKLKKKYNHDP